jgi:hypothetical protein
MEVLVIAPMREEYRSACVRAYWAGQGEAFSFFLQFLNQLDFKKLVLGKRYSKI